MKETKDIVILGGGYGGVRAAKLLNKRFKKDENVRIVLVDKKPYHTLMTDLHEIAGARIEEEAVQVNLKKIFSATKVKVVTDEIKNIDFKAQKLASETETYNYDYLVIGVGSEPAFFGVPGVQENGFTIWSMEDALKIHEHIKEMFRRASMEKNPEKRKEMLTFVVAGAGFTGIEVVGELLEWKTKLCKEYFVDEKEVRLMVVEALGKILPILSDKLIKKSEKYLRKHGVEVLTNAPITEVSDRKVTLKDGTEIPTKTLIWTCGVQGSSFAANLGLTMGKRGRVQTNEFMQSMDYNNVYLIGDNEYFEEDSKPLPQIVETALQTADTAVHNITADIKGGEKKAFKSNYHGLMVSIGSRYAVASVSTGSYSGFMAMAIKHLVNMHYLFGIGGFNLVWRYFEHEFLKINSNRSIIGGHASNKAPIFWLAILRVYVGVMWVIEGVNKIKEGWLNPQNIHIVSTTVSGATQTTAETTTQAAPALISQPPAFYTWFMDKFIAPHAFFFQACIVLAEIAIGLALIAGLFTVLASLASVFLGINFILSAMATADIFWYIFAGIALMGGAGRVLGLDYWVIPWLKNWWNRTFLARKTYLYID